MASRDNTKCAIHTAFETDLAAVVKDLKTIIADKNMSGYYRNGGIPLSQLADFLSLNTQVQSLVAAANAKMPVPVKK